MRSIFQLLNEIWMKQLYTVLCLSLKPSITVPFSITISVVYGLRKPPRRYTPEGVTQETWLRLLNFKVCDRIHLPLAQVSHSVRICELLFNSEPNSNSPPHTSPPSWLWYLLISGICGREHLVFVSGRYISADISALSLEAKGSVVPPVVRIPVKLWV